MAERQHHRGEVSPIATIVPFEWRIYADATCAGLAALIPLPLVDYLVESTFRRRMPQAIRRFHGIEVDPSAIRTLGRPAPLLNVSGCLLLPFAALLYLLKRLSRKILYVLTIRDAARSLSAYWHRAHLIDHMVRAGHVSPGQPVSLALASFQNSLDETSIVGLRQCGRQLIRGAHHIFSTLMRALRQGADSSLRPQAAFLKDQWETMAVTLAKAVDSYEHHYLAGDCAALPTTTGAPPQDG